ncbi:hypothetical protein PTTG_26276 [Puccinia triticina 1-1 BBBD Race 1]|uniref:Uncharacterized protein n=1 Tax=Puccinia triticina (isolate 1-1 / race 1 (BBBD)) TaxID=630390 RepID=A0A180GUW9_PUCT1|nr:hypothetical protein PTTG_26276 [Puccinia triticina 1-1 BBBD Race 1]
MGCCSHAGVAPSQLPPPYSSIRTMHRPSSSAGSGRPASSQWQITVQQRNIKQKTNKHPHGPPDPGKDTRRAAGIRQNGQQPPKTTP